jgi:hypothetical protein
MADLRLQLMNGEVQPSFLLTDDFLSSKRPGMANAKGPSSGMPSIGGLGVRPGGPRGIAAPGQAVRPRGGAPFVAAVNRPVAQAPKMFRPIGALTQRPVANTPRLDESPRE